MNRIPVLMVRHSLGRRLLIGIARKSRLTLLNPESLILLPCFKFAPLNIRNSPKSRSYGRIRRYRPVDHRSDYTRQASRRNALSLGAIDFPMLPTGFNFSINLKYMRERRHFSTYFRGESKVSHLQIRNFEATAGDRPCVTHRGTRAGSDNRAEV